MTFDDTYKLYKNNEDNKDFNKVDDLELVKTDAIDKEPIIAIDCTL